MIYTENYQLRKPVIGVDNADVNDLNYNSDRIDAIMHSSQISLADAYDLNSTYNTGDVVMYEFLMYRCLEDNVTGVWNPEKWTRTTAGEESGGGADLDIYGEGSGSVVTITDGAEAGLAECIAEIEVTQSGSGTPSPSNVRPISGWDEIKVQRTGKNVFGGLPMAQEIERCGYNTNLDTTNKIVTFTRPVESGGSYERILSENYKFKNNTTYTFIATYSNNANNTVLRFKYSDGTNSEIALTNSNGQKTTIIAYSDSNKSLKEIVMNFYSTGQTDLYYEESGLFEGILTTDDFEEYQGQTYTIPLGRTVYGGTLDVTRGVLTVDRGYKLYTGDASESWSFSTDFVYINISDALRPQSSIGIQSNIIVTATGRDAYTGFINQYGNLIIYVPSSITSVTDWKTWLSSNNLQIVYELATPQTYTLTPEEVSTILGYNNISADSGDVSVVYVRQTAPIKPNPTGADIPLTGLEISGKGFKITRVAHLLIHGRTHRRKQNENSR